MAAAITEFLAAAGHDPTLAPELRRTPDRVAEAFCESFLDGYAQDPRELLSERSPAPDRGPIVVRDVAFHALCPHHLLPMTGRAHIGYVPRGDVVGFSRLVKLVDCFAHRLVLQESIAKKVADALVDVLGAKAAFCALDADQGCMTLRGVKKPGAKTITSSVLGGFRSDARTRAEAMSLIKG